MLLTVTIDFDLPRDAAKLADLAEVFAPAPTYYKLADSAPEADSEGLRDGESAQFESIVPAPEAKVVKKRGRPAKTAVVPVPDAAPVEEPVAEAPTLDTWTLGPTCGNTETVPLAPEQEAHTWEVTTLDDPNTRVYQEETPAVTLDDVKAALMAYFEKDKVGAINLVRSYGVQQYTQVPPEKFAEFVGKCKDGGC
jgi:hypothetical protein